MLSVIALFGFLAVPTPVSASTSSVSDFNCNSATFNGTVITGTPPARAHFEFGTNFNTVANGGGTRTSTQTFNTDGTFSIEQFISGLQENTTYFDRLVVTNDFGTDNSNIISFTTPNCNNQINNPQFNNPSVDLNANPNTIQTSQGSTLTWNSQNVSSCFASWTGNTSPNGSVSVFPGFTTTFTITCQGFNGQTVNDSATVVVIGQPIQINNPNVRLFASPNSINSGQGSTLTWNSQNVSSCFASWTGNTSPNGSTVVSPSFTTTFNITCQGFNGQSTNDSVTVFVNQQQIIQNNPNVNIFVNPTVVVFTDQTSVPFNGSATIRWITTNATSCFASGGSTGWAGTKSIGPGSFFTGSLTSSKTFTLTCSNNFASVSDSETVTVRAQTSAVVASSRPAPTSLVLISSSVDRNQPIVSAVDNTKPRPGDEINYTVNFQNIGTGSITNLSLRINLPSEVNYLSSSPSNPNISGNTLIFNLGTLRANGQGTVTIRTRVQNNIPAGTNLNFPAILSYINPSGQPQSVSTDVSAQVLSSEETTIPLVANVFGAGFLPTNLFGWLLLLVLILLLVFLSKYVFDQSFRKKTTTVVDQPSGKKTTTTTA